MADSNQAVLLLEDGTVFKGKGFGFTGSKTGEVVFNTALTGYEEILTDPSYCGQIVTMCYPHIGNYGINYEDNESYKIWVEGFVVRESSKIYSSHRAKESLDNYLKQNQIVGIEDIDTRHLVRLIREKGSMKGVISSDTNDIRHLKQEIKNTPSILGRDLVKEVNDSDFAVYKKHNQKKENKGPAIALVDFGVKLNIIRNFENLGVKVRVFPANTTIDEILDIEPDGVLLSNGPGDPKAVSYGIELAGDLIDYNKDNRLPLMGICLGHQLIGLGAGARTYKLKFGHHGGNHPVKELSTGKIEITAQNHNFCVDVDTISSDFVPTHINLNDKTIEGIKHKQAPIVSFQYHPEAGPGPHDSQYLFKRFKEMING